MSHGSWLHHGKKCSYRPVSTRQRGRRQSISIVHRQLRYVTLVTQKKSFQGAEIGKRVLKKIARTYYKTQVGSCQGPNLDCSTFSLGCLVLSLATCQDVNVDNANVNMSVSAMSTWTMSSVNVDESTIDKTMSMSTMDNEISTTTTTDYRH